MALHDLKIVGDHKHSAATFQLIYHEWPPSRPSGYLANHFYDNNECEFIENI